MPTDPRLNPNPDPNLVCGFWYADIVRRLPLRRTHVQMYACTQIIPAQQKLAVPHNGVTWQKSGPVVTTQRQLTSGHCEMVSTPVKGHLNRKLTYQHII